MEIELLEIRDFLAQHPPFSYLDADQLDALPARLTIRYLRAGESLPDELDGTSAIAVVRKGAIELRSPMGVLMARLGEGELHTAACVEVGRELTECATALEDTLIYQLSCSTLEQLRHQSDPFSAHFERSIHRRLSQALSHLQQSALVGGANLMTMEVGRLATRPGVILPASVTIRQAAECMSAEGISSLLLGSAERVVGVVTDRDLRRRCVAVGRSFDEPVASIMTEGVESIEWHRSAAEALLLMTRLHTHHLPVAQAGVVIGMVSTTDLVRLQGDNPLYLLNDIEKAEDLAALEAIGGGLPDLQKQLLQVGMGALQLGELFTHIADTLTRRLITLAERELGSAPTPYLWMVGGSQGRREQMVHTDQDSALLLDNSVTAEQRDYFHKLAVRVRDGLARCGYSLCQGEVMSSNPLWCQPLSRWQYYFSDWIGDPQTKSLMLINNFLDMRPLHGDQDLWKGFRAHIHSQVSGNQIFLAAMAAHAVRQRPPIGFFRGFVLSGDGEHANTLDLKQQAIMPIVNLARLHALSCGSDAINTLKRLHSEANNPVLSSEGRHDLADLFTLISALRADHQGRQVLNGVTVDNYLNPTELSSLERRHLKDAFVTLRTIQDAIAQGYQSDRF